MVGVMNLKPGDICIYINNPKTITYTRRVIAFGQFITHPLSSRINSEFEYTHAGIYIGKEQGNVTLEHTPELIVGMERDGLGVDQVHENECIAVLRPKNTDIATFIADLAMHWALNSPKSKYSILSCFKALVPHKHIIDPKALERLENEIGKQLDINFMCSQFVISCLYVAIDELNKLGANLSTKDFVDISTFYAPDQLFSYLNNNSNYETVPPQVFHNPGIPPIPFEFEIAEEETWNLINKH